MAKKLKVGDVIRGYRITKVIGPGMMAISYAARAATGAKVFLKQYKSPAPTVVWYDAFVAYQRELSARVRDGKAAHFAVNQVDAFEETWGGLSYFQAYEFVCWPAIIRIGPRIRRSMPSAFRSMPPSRPPCSGR